MKRRNWKTKSKEVHNKIFLTLIIGLPIADIVDNEVGAISNDLEKITLSTDLDAIEVVEDDDDSTVTSEEQRKLLRMKRSDSKRKLRKRGAIPFKLNAILNAFHSQDSFTF